MAFVLTARERRILALFVVVVLVVRLATLGAYPLMDSTESRYGEIARKMVETGRWLVPQFDYGVPFWGKPPLSTWLSAAAMSVFGVGEFSARLPSFVLLVAGCAPLAWLAVRRAGRDYALWTLALFVATALVFIAGGAVMTDPALAFGTTLSMAGFWLAVAAAEGPRRMAATAFFLGLAIGLLAKGPVALVLTLIPIGAWTIATGRWNIVWTRLPWLIGVLATAALVVPWYWAAERATPGFLDYFLAGEHWKRFVEPGWKGDLYGAAHARPRGMIWLFWIAAALPWSAAALAWLTRAIARRHSDLWTLVADPWRLYLVLWTVTPMAFFTLSGNILVTYVLPGLPAFALLVGELGGPAHDERGTLRPGVRALVVAGSVLPVLFIAGLATQRMRLESAHSQLALVRTWESLRAGSGQRLVYAGAPPPSADFYSRGAAAHVADVTALVPILEDPAADFIALRAGDLARLPAATRYRLESLGEFGDYRLLRETSR